MSNTSVYCGLGYVNMTDSEGHTSTGYLRTDGVTLEFDRQIDGDIPGFERLVAPLGDTVFGAYDAVNGVYVTTILVDFNSIQFYTSQPNGKYTPGAIVPIPGSMMGTFTIKSQQALGSIWLGHDVFAHLDALPDDVTSPTPTSANPQTDSNPLVPATPAETPTSAETYTGTLVNGAFLIYAPQA